MATLDKISQYYWLENQKSIAGIGKYNLADWAKPFFEYIDTHALKISDINNPDQFVTELLNFELLLIMKKKTKFQINILLLTMFPKMIFLLSYLVTLLLMILKI